MDKFEELLAEERRVFIAGEVMLRAFIGNIPQLSELEIENHMQACRDFLKIHDDIYRSDSPFALKHGKGAENGR